MNFLAVPTFVKAMKDVTLIDGKPLKLEVVVNGIPKPTLQWLKDDETLDEAAFTCESKDKSHTLSIGAASPNYAGIYKAVAENSAGKSEVVAKVDVQTKPKIVKPNDVRIIAGSEFSIPVCIEGVPEPKIKWMKDKVELPTSLGVSIIKNENMYVMYLAESTTNLNGNYSIAATNPAGTDTVNFKVAVLGTSM